MPIEKYHINMAEYLCLLAVYEFVDSGLDGYNCSPTTNFTCPPTLQCRSPYISQHCIISLILFHQYIKATGSTARLPPCSFYLLTVFGGP